MLMSEFIERTGFTPTYEEYQEIEEAYYNFDGNKDAFCKAFVDGNGEKRVYTLRATRIEQLKSQLLESDRTIKEVTAKYEQMLQNIRAELDRALEWKPCTGSGTNMAQERYELLVNAGQGMSDEEAKAFVSEECGFAPERIRILHEVSTYEVNKYHHLRKSGTFIRTPVYESTDWNYVRFDCGNRMYELLNGELQFYCC